MEYHSIRLIAEQRERSGKEERETDSYGVHTRHVIDFGVSVPSGGRVSGRSAAGEILWVAARCALVPEPIDLSTALGKELIDMNEPFKAT